MRGVLSGTFLLAFCTLEGVAENTWTPWHTKRVLPEHELSTNAITNVTKVANDEVWVATTERVYLSNGWSIRSVDTEWIVNAKYPLQRVLGFFRANLSSLYMFTIRDGIYKLSESLDRFRPLKTNSPWSTNNSIRSLLFDTHHNLALSIIDDRVFVFSPIADSVYELPLDGKFTPAALLQSKESSDLYVLTNNKELVVFIWQKDRFVKHSETPCNIKAIAIDSTVSMSENVFYLVEHNGGIVKARVSNLGCAELPLSRAMQRQVQHASVHSITPLEQSGGIALATDHGAFIEQGQHSFLISSNNSLLFSDEVLSIEEIGLNRVLLGSFLGLTQASKEGAIIVTSLGTENHPSVTSIDSSSTLGTYVSTYQNLYRAIPSSDNIQFQKLKLRSDLSSISVVKVGTSSIWLGFQDGRILQLSEHGENVLCEYIPDSEDKATAVTDISLVEGNDNKAVGATLAGEIILIDNCESIGSTTLVSSDKQELMVVALVPVGNSDAIAMAIDGTALIPNLTNTLTSRPDKLIVESIDGLGEAWGLASNSEFYFALFPDGLVQKIPTTDIQDRRITTVEAQWDIGKSAYAIELDSKGRAWVASNVGLHLLEEGRTSVPIQTYGDIPVSLDFGASHTSSDGRIYFGGTGGILVLATPESYPLNPSLDFVLTKITTGSKEHSLPHYSGKPLEVELPAGDNLLGISFSLTDFEIQERVLLKYKLEGFDSTWRSAGNSNTVNYSKLPPGDYVFRARGSNASGTWSEDEIAVSVRVVGPLWLSWWAILSYLLLAGALLLLARRVHEGRVAGRLRLEIAEDTAAAYQQLEDHYQELQDAFEHSLRSRSISADGVLALAKLSADPSLAPVSDLSGDAYHTAVSSRLENLRQVQMFASRASTGDRCDMNATLESLHKQLIAEQPETASAILINDVTSEPVALNHASHLALVLYEVLTLTLRERGYEEGEDPILEIRMGPPELKENGVTRYLIYVRDSALPDQDGILSERALPLAHHFVESTGGELSQTYDHGNVLNIILDLESAE